jgi:hypothetical protein
MLSNLQYQKLRYYLYHCRIYKMKSFFIVIVIINIQLVIPFRTIDSNRRLALTSTESESENINVERKKYFLYSGMRNGFRNKRPTPQERNSTEFSDKTHRKDIEER